MKARTIGIVLMTVGAIVLIAGMVNGKGVAIDYLYQSLAFIAAGAFLILWHYKKRPAERKGDTVKA